MNTMMSMTMKRMMKRLKKRIRRGMNTSPIVSQTEFNLRLRMFVVEQFYRTGVNGFLEKDSNDTRPKFCPLVECSLSARCS